MFVANTHTPVLFFTTGGMAFVMKVYKLPLGTPQARGKALVNLLPLRDAESIATVMPLPEDEDSWADLHVMFATSAGTVRRNSLSDFTNIKANGKIAMKLEDEHGNSLGKLIAVQTCAEDQDVLLAAGGGKSIRFPVTAVRVFVGRNSTGVRGIKLAKDDKVISMSILDHVAIDVETRDAFLKYAGAQRRGEEAGEGEVPALPAAELEALQAGEEMILTITENGFGKRTSAYDYRIAGRGGQGIISIETSARNGPVVASFPVEASDEILLVTDAGQLIRCPVHDIRIAARNTQGVTLFKTGQDERVVSVTRLSDDNGDVDETDDETGDEDDENAERGTGERGETDE